MKDTRTWWRKGDEIAYILFDIYWFSKDPIPKIMTGRFVPTIKAYDNGEIDCASEALWAVREKLTDKTW